MSLLSPLCWVNCAFECPLESWGVMHSIKNPTIQVLMSRSNLIGWPQLAAPHSFWNMAWGPWNDPEPNTRYERFVFRLKTLIMGIFARSEKYKARQCYAPWKIDTLGNTASMTRPTFWTFEAPLMINVSSRILFGSSFSICGKKIFAIYCASFVHHSLIVLSNHRYQEPPLVHESMLLAHWIYIFLIVSPSPRIPKP